MKWLISHKEGQFLGLNPTDERELIQLKSYRKHQIFVKDRIVRTQNCFSWAGAVVLANADEAALERDYERFLVFYIPLEFWDSDFISRVESMEKTSLFSVLEASSTTDPKAVIVVDPFSTGALLAAELYSMGMKVIAVYSAQMDKLENLKNLVPQGLNIVFEEVVPFNTTIDDLVRQFRRPGFTILAIFAGAETGIRLFLTTVI